MTAEPALLVAVAFLAYANGANDNFKGVATLHGSGTLGYRAALAWATLTTLAGSWAALGLSHGLVRAFSGRGLVPDALTAEPAFLLAVGGGGAAAVLLATAAGLPISTTHALIGGLVGAGLAAGPVDAARLGQGFVLPLAVSPFLGFALTATLLPLVRSARGRLGRDGWPCLCVGAVAPAADIPGGAAAFHTTGLVFTLAATAACREPGRPAAGIAPRRALDRLHLASAGAVGFARGLNDTPKIVALLVASRALALAPAAEWVAIGLVMAAGGVLSARRVAVTMSRRITPMTHGQGLTANLVTAGLVTLASGWGLPVSTTHVACGSLFGLGAASRGARWEVIRVILLAWLLTLPAAALAAAALLALQR